MDLFDDTFQAVSVARLDDIVSINIVGLEEWSRFLGLDFWDKNTMECTSAMPYRRDFLATTRIQEFQA